jgi:hypothetical protein
MRAQWLVNRLVRKFRPCSAAPPLHWRCLALLRTGPRRALCDRQTSGGLGGVYLKTIEGRPVRNNAPVGTPRAKNRLTSYCAQGPNRCMAENRSRSMTGNQQHRAPDVCTVQGSKKGLGQQHGAAPRISELLYGVNLDRKSGNGIPVPGGPPGRGLHQPCSPKRQCAPSRLRKRPNSTTRPAPGPSHGGQHASRRHFRPNCPRRIPGRA